MRHVAIVGASGFVGSAVDRVMRERGFQTAQLKAPRIRVSKQYVADFVGREQRLTKELAEAMSGVDVVVCAAGIADASSREEESLYGANAALPGLVAAAAVIAEIPRMVHVSSAVVQGAQPELDDSPVHSPTSAYGRSKAAGESLLLNGSPPASTVIYRPPSVHSPTRRITRAIYRIANSPASSVISPGNQPTPQAHIVNVASAVSYLAESTMPPPPIVQHPWEGWTTASFLELFANGRPPKLIPQRYERALSIVMRRSSSINLFAANARRLEMLWYGQRQAPSWLIAQGWSAPATHDAWEALVSETARKLHP